MYSQHMISNSAKNAHGERTVSSTDHLRSIGRLYAREILYQKEKKNLRILFQCLERSTQSRTGNVLFSL